MIIEIWKDIKDYEGLYQISSLGRVRHVPKNFYLKSNYTPNGYEKVTLTKNKNKKYPNVHRLLAMHFLENVRAFPCVNHKNGNKQDNSLGNLEWCSYSMNNKHAFKMGLNRPVKGEDKWNAKLKTYQVVEIREKYGTGLFYLKTLARDYNVNISIISRIVNYKIWKHI